MSVTREITTVSNLHHDITLCVIVDDPKEIEHRYSVQYGHEVHLDLNYAQACKQFGLCVMHSAQCMGLLDS